VAERILLQILYSNVKWHVNVKVMAKIIIFLKKNLAVAAMFHLRKIAIPSVGIERVGSNFVGRHEMYSKMAAGALFDFIKVPLVLFVRHLRTLTASKKLKTQFFDTQTAKNCDILLTYDKL